jgi:hypothetical protein
VRTEASTPPSQERFTLSRRQALAIGALACLPVPAFSASSQVIPLPPLVERIAASVVPLTNWLASGSDMKAPAATDRTSPPGKITLTAAERSVGEGPVAPIERSASRPVVEGRAAARKRHPHRRVSSVPQPILERSRSVRSFPDESGPRAAPALASPLSVATPAPSAPAGTGGQATPRAGSSATGTTAAQGSGQGATTGSASGNTGGQAGSSATGTTTAQGSGRGATTGGGNAGGQAGSSATGTTTAQGSGQGATTGGGNAGLGSQSSGSSSSGGQETSVATTGGVSGGAAGSGTATEKDTPRP